MSGTTHHLPPGAVDWLANGERGNSSEAIFARLTGLPIGGSRCTSHPLDPADLRRCRLLLEAVPAFRARLEEVADVSPVWAALVARWDEVCSLMDEEAPDWRDGSGGAPRTYALMGEIEQAAS